MADSTGAAGSGEGDDNMPGNRSYKSLNTGLLGLTCGATALFLLGVIFDATQEDFRLSGTQIGDVGPHIIHSSITCAMCHGDFDARQDPYAAWSGSKMAQAGRNPLFYAQMALANQDVANVGTFCMRCHVPMSFVSGHAADPSGDSLTDVDRDGVSCHLCHAMVDPVYVPGVSPPEDEAALASLADVPQHYGNAMFALDPLGRRRGVRADGAAAHEIIYSPFHRSGSMCGTCHDVGNVAISREPDGTYRYNALNERVPDEDPHAQFPLERTYTEWKLSAFADGGVDMGGRFGGVGVTVVSSCQDCHMPRVAAQACFFGPERPDHALHDFAGAGASVLEIIALYYADDPLLDPNAIEVGIERAISMLERAASLDLAQECGTLRARVINETGHKLPTGHIEGRRVWVNARFYDQSGALLREYGAYDADEAVLDGYSTRVYEMHVGLSEYAASVTGLPAGKTMRMALADTVVKDNRIPPRGFNNAAFETGGAPVVAAHYADGQYWDDVHFAIPQGAASAEVNVYYQNMPRWYIEYLRDANVTNHWGQTLYDLWEATGKGAPNRMVTMHADLTPFLPADLDCDCHVGASDLLLLLQAFGTRMDDLWYDGRADLDGDHAVTLADLSILLSQLGRSCP